MASGAQLRRGGGFHSAGMVKFLLPFRSLARSKSKSYRRGNHARFAEGPLVTGPRSDISNFNRM